MRRHNLSRGRPPRLLTITVAVTVAAAVWLAGTMPVQAAPATPRVADWIRHHANQLTTIDPAAPLDDLAPLRRMIGDARIVGLGESTHGAHEEFALKHRVLRLLVEKMGFRSIAWEDDWTVSPLVNDYIVNGNGSLDAVMREMITTWQSREVAAVLQWLHDYNAGHRDKVRFVGLEFFATRILAYDAVAAFVARTAPARVPDLQADLQPIRPFTPNIGEYVGWYFGVQDKQPYIDHARRVYDLVKGLPHARGDRAWALALHNARQILSFYEYFDLSPQDGFNYRDARAAENLRWWRQRTGDKIAYWAASPHTANGPGVQLSEPPEPLVQWDSVGSHLRRWYGGDYRSIGFTFDHGTVNVGSRQPPFTPEPVAVPRPERDWGDRPLGDANLDQFALDLTTDAPPAVRAWRQAPTRIRAVASFDPQQPDAYYMAGGSLAQWFDVIVHRQVVTPWRPL